MKILELSRESGSKEFGGSHECLWVWSPLLRDRLRRYLTNSTEECCCSEMDDPDYLSELRGLHKWAVWDECFCWTLAWQHEWSPLGKLRGDRFPPTQQHSAHQDETAVNFWLTLWIPQDVPLWFSSKLPPPLSSAVPQTPDEPELWPEALHLGTHTQVVSIIQSPWHEYYMYVDGFV